VGAGKEQKKRNMRWASGGGEGVRGGGLSEKKTRWRKGKRTRCKLVRTRGTEGKWEKEKLGRTEKKKKKKKSKIRACHL